MFVLMRALTYAAVFIGLVLVFLPAQVLSWSGIGRPATLGWMQLGGAALVAAGATLAVWCVVTFALVGRGTPAPFDPPRRLVTAGPYRFVRNPMYIGAGLALAGAAAFYGSVPLLAFAAGFFLVTHLFVIAYEEPTLRRMFPSEYAEYTRRVRRWRPGRPRRQKPEA